MTPILAILAQIAIVGAAFLYWLNLIGLKVFDPRGDLRWTARQKIVGAVLIVAVVVAFGNVLATLAMWVGTAVGYR